MAFLYPFWHQFPARDASVAMDVVGRELPPRLAAAGRTVALYSSNERTHSQRARLRGSTVVADDVLYPRVADANHLVAKAGEIVRRGLRAAGLPVRPEWYYSGHALHQQLAYGVPAMLDVRRRGFEIVHVCIFDELLPLVRALSPRSKIVLHMHDHKQAFRDFELTRRRLAFADAIVGVSDFVTERVAARFPELAGRCHAIWNATSTPASAPGPGDSAGRPARLLFCGRLSPEKGVHTILEAYRAILARHPATELAIVGPDRVAPVEDADPSGADPRFTELRRWYDDPAAYARLLRDLVPEHARGQVRFVGPLDHDELDGWFARSDVILFPSIWDEPFGLPVIEGMAAERPVVATCVGAFPETIEDGVSGILVDPADPAELAAAVIRLLDDERFRRRIAAAARRRATSVFSWPDCIVRWQQLYDGV